jgi:hypothetical protein
MTPAPGEVAACPGSRRRPARRRGAGGAGLGELLASLLAAAAGGREAASGIRITEVDLKVPAELRFEPPVGAAGRAGGRGRLALRSPSLRRHPGLPPLRPVEIVLEACDGGSEPTAAAKPPAEEEP